MGISYLDLRQYFQARLNGVSFNKTITVGHQNLWLHPHEVKLLRRVYYREFPNSKVDFLRHTKPGDYADGILRDLLNIQTLSVIDYSPYEGADIIHDLNLPIRDELIERFDAVIDGGSIEHIFNFPIAISNMMTMAKIGGKIFITTAANNYCGHGFYQFSPELMFRVFAAENGFKLDQITMFPASKVDFSLTSNQIAYEVTDPANISDRVELVSKWPVLMMVEATKISRVSIFTKAPLQSDYAERWNHKGPASNSGDSLKNTLKRYYDKMPRILKLRILELYIRKRNSFSNPAYKKLKM